MASEGNRLPASVTLHRTAWHRALSRTAEPRILFPVIAAVLLAAIWITTLGIIRLKHADAERAAAASGRELLGTYEAQIVRALREIDHTLNLVKYWPEKPGGQGKLAELKSRGLLPPDLLFVVSIADRQGTIVDSTRASARQNVADRDYFRAQLKRDTFFVEQPPRGSTGDAKLHFSRRLEVDGVFAGVVIVAVDAAYFVSGYEPGKLGKSGVLGLLGTDGIVRVRRSGDAVFSGDPVDYPSMVPESDSDEPPVTVAAAPWDGVRRWTVARQLYQFPLAILVGLSAEEQMAPVERDVRRYLSWAVFGSLGVLMVTALLGRLSWQLTQSRNRESEAKLAHARRVEYLAYHDGLTGLPNRSLFSKLLTQGINEAQRYQRHLAVAFLDLDRFKQINDTLGHEAGDQLLREAASRLRECLRDSDTVARLGGDEFVVLLPELDGEYAVNVAQKILAVIGKPYTLIGYEFRVTASIGIAVYPQDGLDEQTLTKNADIAMYQAKSEGKNRLQFYSEALNANSLQRLTLESSLRHALENQEFRLHYQAKRDIRSGRISGMEALLRWEHPDVGTVAPMQFIPIAEETGLIVPIGKWVLRTACQQSVAWQKQGLPPLSMAVNLTARQFRDEHLLQDVKQILEVTHMDPQLLELEISEALLIRDVEQTLRTLAGLKGLGVRIAIDDFGTGYSSLATLQRFPLDTIKIDRTFVRDITGAADENSLADALIAMGRSLSLTVVAQGVETREQADFLRAHTCDELQGFYFKKPLPADQFTQLLLAQCNEATGKDLALKSSLMDAAPPPGESLPGELDVLLIEDCAPDIHSTMAQLARGGFCCRHRVVASETQLRHALQECIPSVILSDLSLPGFGGMAALAIAQARVPDVPFLFLSATMGEERAIEALRRGAMDYVLKSNPKRLVPAVRRALAEAELRRTSRAAERRVVRLSGVLQMLSGINAAVVRIQDRDALLNEACRLAHRVGGYAAAMIAMIVPTTRSLRAVAWGGLSVEAASRQIFMVADSEAADASLTSHVMRTGVAMVCDDIARSPRPVSNRDTLLKAGIHCLACLPLRVDDTPVGAFLVGALEPGLIGDEELLLLQEVSANLSFALQYLDKRNAAHFLVYFDPLTGLAKRALFCERIGRLLDRVGERSPRMVVAVFDLDHLSVVNDSLGRHTGDRLLQCVAERLKARWPDTERLAHLGGGTFVIVTALGKRSEHELQELHRDITRQFDGPFVIDGRDVLVTVTCGFACYPENGREANELVQNAEAALKEAKTSGEKYLRHRLEMNSALAARVSMEHRLRAALQREQFVLHYQPKLRMKTGRIEGVEALLRWQDPRHGLVAPGTFLPILESAGLMPAVSTWALRQAAADCREWQSAGLPAVRVAVNISPPELRRRGFVQEVLEAVAPLSGDPRWGVDIEVTEGALFGDSSSCVHALRLLRASGMRIAIDDFGTGHSSLGRLSELPIDSLKIDQLFTSRIPADRKSCTLVATIIELAHAFDMTTVAEGVETSEQRDYLASVGCDESQGFLHSRPIPKADFERLLVSTNGSASPKPAASGSDSGHSPPASHRAEKRENRIGYRVGVLRGAETEE